MRISDWSSDVCSSDLSASGWRELKAIEHRRLLVVALVTAQPPLRNARVPPKFRIFRAQKTSRQTLARAASELDLQTCDQCRHHAIRDGRTWLSNGHVNLNPLGVLLIEDSPSPAPAGASVRTAGSHAQTGRASGR